MYSGASLPTYRSQGRSSYKRYLSRRQTAEAQKWCLLVCAALLIVTLLILQRGGGGSTIEPPASGGQRLEVQRRATLSSLVNLVLVACHAVYVGTDYSNADDLASWFLLDYQQVPGQTESFLQHMQLGVRAAADDPAALLVFSGGQTRAEAGARSEAQSYRNVAQARQWFGHDGVAARTVTEEHARDSFENLMFSICRFRQVTGHYPQNILVVSFEFKHQRFAAMHRVAMLWPLQRFRFLGTPALSEAALQGEAQTVSAFRRDPHGCGKELSAKRSSRDPYSNGPKPPNMCSEMAALMAHCGEATYKGKPLPWEGQLRISKGIEE